MSIRPKGKVYSVQSKTTLKEFFEPSSIRYVLKKYVTFRNCRLSIAASADQRGKIMNKPNKIDLFCHKSLPSSKDVCKMQYVFDFVYLMLNERIEIWKKMKHPTAKRSNIFLWEK